MCGRSLSDNQQSSRYQRLHSVKGAIESHSFQQTLCPIKNSFHRLYVNMPMLKGSGKTIGDIAAFEIEQDDKPKTAMPAMVREFKNSLVASGLMIIYQRLKPSRRKEILKYLRNLKTAESRQRNIEKIIAQLKQT